MCFNKYKNDPIIPCEGLFGPYEIQTKKQNTLIKIIILLTKTK